MFDWVLYTLLQTPKYNLSVKESFVVLIMANDAFFNGVNQYRKYFS